MTGVQDNSTELTFTVVFESYWEGVEHDECAPIAVDATSCPEDDLRSMLDQGTAGFPRRAVEVTIPAKAVIEAFATPRPKVVGRVE